MSDLRAMIREVLAEEISSLRAELLGRDMVERVAVGNEQDLTAFALSIARRAQDPGFLSALQAGQIRFAPMALQAAAPAPAPAPALAHVSSSGYSAPAPVAAPIPAAPTPLVTTLPPSVPELRKGLITERDIAAVATGETRLRITKLARLTPLASDEARRRGIRIERTLA